MRRVSDLFADPNAERKQADSPLTAAAKPSVESTEKKEMADPEIEKVTEAIAKADVHTS